MDIGEKPSRRRVLKTGIASIATAAVSTPEIAAVVKPKAPGETKVVAALGYDGMHNGLAYETHLRSIFSSKKDWRLIFVRQGKYFSPELISDADLLMIQLFGGIDSEGIGDSMEKQVPAWTDKNVEAIIDNVKNRGMGLLALHNAIWIGHQGLHDLIGTTPVLHQEIQPLILKDFNQDHAITKGFESFFVNLEEQFNVELQSPSTTTLLFRTLAVHDKNDAVGGWCREQGKGRIVGLLPGHEHWIYRLPEYQEIIWRSAHWALKRDIPPYTG